MTDVLDRIKATLAAMPPAKVDPETRDCLSAGEVDRILRDAVNEMKAAPPGFVMTEKMRRDLRRELLVFVVGVAEGRGLRFAERAYTDTLTDEHWTLRPGSPRTVEEMRRVLWEAVRGELLPKEAVIEFCDEPGCFRPDHLLASPP